MSQPIIPTTIWVLNQVYLEQSLLQARAELMSIHGQYGDMKHARLHSPALEMIFNVFPPQEELEIKNGPVS